MIEQRRCFRMRPEVPLRKEDISGMIKQQLDEMGVPHEEPSPDCGLVATIQRKSGIKIIGVRVDIDILPMQGESDIPYKSKCNGVMHACGYDAHIAMLLGVAKVLNDYKEHLEGAIRPTSQSTEEADKGYMGVLDHLDRAGDVDRLIGLHIWNTLSAGEILLIPDSVLVGGSGFTIMVKGRGGHGVRPDLIEGSIKAACDVVLEILVIPNNMYDVLDHSAVSTGMIEDGALGNIFPNTATIKGTTRYYKPGGDEALMGCIRRIGAGVGMVHGVEVDCSSSEGILPVYNQPELITRARELVDGIDGLVASPQQDPICAGDSFGCILQGYPGFHGVLGVENKKIGCSWSQHNTKFNVDESSLRGGCEFTAAYVVDYLG